MARLETCARTFYLRKMLRAGRIVAAKQQAVAWLREGYASKPFLALIADLLDPKRGKGTRSRRPPLQWLGIGEAFEAVRRDGFTHEQAILIVADRFRRSSGFIDKTVSYYRAVQADYADPPVSGRASQNGDAAEQA